MAAKRHYLKFKIKSGSSILIMIFILTGVMIAAFSGSYMILAGLNSSGVQYDSSRAYFVAEAGMEYTLYQIRHEEFNLGSVPSVTPLFPQLTMPNDSNSSFLVYYKQFSPIKIDSEGQYGQTKRSVETTF
jgi:hypothetical protein